MDFLQDYVWALVQPIYSKSRSSPSSYLSYLPRPIADQISTFQTSYFDSLTSIFPAQETLISTILLIILLFISLKVLDYTRRMIMWWVNAGIRLVFYGALIGGAWYVYKVGWERAWRELGWAMGLVEGFSGILFERWMGGEQNVVAGRAERQWRAGRTGMAGDGWQVPVRGRRQGRWT